jgi:hypothetical protein
MRNRPIIHASRIYQTIPLSLPMAQTDCSSNLLIVFVGYVISSFLSRLTTVVDYVDDSRNVWQLV